MSIRTKLFSAFSGIVILMTVIGIWNILTLNKMLMQFNQISVDTVPVIVALKNIRTASLKMESDAISAVMIQSETVPGLDKDIKKETEKFRTSKEKLHIMAAEYIELVKMSDQGFVQKIILTINTCSQIGQDMVDLKSKGAVGKEILDKKQEFENMQNELLLLLDREIRLELSQFKKLSLSVSHGAERSIIVLLSILIIGIMSSLTLGFTISNKIGMSVTRLKDAAEKVAKGKSDILIQVESEDEIGQLTASFYNMSEELMIFREDIERRTLVLTQSNVSLLEEIEKRKRTERYLKWARIKAEAASQAKSEFLTNLSHEIRTPLNGIIGYTELGMDAEPEPELMNIFSKINTGANALLDVVNDILDFSKIEGGSLELEDIPFDLKCTIEDLADIIAFRAEQKGLKSSSYISADVPYQLIGDPGRLRQIITNITSNALKFTSEGEIFIRAEMVEDTGSRVKIRFSVKDTGIGIPKDKQASIFRTFPLTDGAASWDYGKTGLGLAISKQLAELMGGKIGVKSEEGKGSEFWFTAVFTKMQSDWKAIRPKQETDLNDLKVLIVDDNPTSRFVLTEYLRSWGCHTVEASDGKEALSILNEYVLSKESFNLILTDFLMPEINGFDLSREIRAMEAFKKVPILVITSAGRTGDGKRSRDLGIDGYLTKPIKMDILHKAIQSVLEISVKQGEPKLVTRHTIAEDYRKD